ncbi:MAG: alpha/beta fold hydrolase [Actinobacteria bacterium]|nr:alpha/beta fold hydrolase [Actinomycetota bacterium]
MPTPAAPHTLEDERSHLQGAAQLSEVQVSEVVTPTRSDVVIDRLRLPYLDWGTAGAPAVLFLHGGALTARTWDLVCLALRDSYRCLALDLRGHGDSDGADRIRRWKFRDYEHDVLQAIVDLPSPPVLIGHSMGALIVRRVLAIYPALAGVLITPAGGNHGLRVLARLARQLPEPVRVLPGHGPETTIRRELPWMRRIASAGRLLVPG